MPCLQGYVKTTYSQLVEKLGEPTYKREGTYSNPTENDGDGTHVSRSASTVTVMEIAV